MVKINEKELENELLKSFDFLDKVKEACKVTISQCLQSPQPFLMNSVVRACLESIDTCDICKMFIINRSPNIKNCITFTLKVLKTNINECVKVKDDKFCKDMVLFCHKLLTETHENLNKLNDSIK